LGAKPLAGKGELRRAKPRGNRNMILDCTPDTCPGELAALIKI
jgi:hypothetical protein